jgi:hypothetical protein
MNRALSPIVFPWMDQFGKTVREAKEMGCAVILCGDAKSGKRHTLDLEAERLRTDTDETAFHVRVQRESDLLKQLYTVLDEISPWMIPTDWRRYSMSSMVKVVARRLRHNNVGLLMLSNAQYLDHTFYDVIFDVMALARSEGHDCGLVFAGRGTIQDYEKQTVNHQASVRQYARVPELTEGDVVAALNEWCGAAKFSEKAQNGDRDAQDSIIRIQTGSGCNIGRLERFAVIKNRRFARREFSPQLVEEIFAEMRQPDRED